MERMEFLERRVAELEAGAGSNNPPSSYPFKDLCNIFAPLGELSKKSPALYGVFVCFFCVFCTFFVLFVIWWMGGYFQLW